MYGVLKAGAVYVPLDPRAPKARLGAIATDCQLSALISTAAGATSLVPAIHGDDLRIAIVVGDDSGPERADRVPIVGFETAAATRVSRSSRRSIRTSRTSSTRRGRPGRRRASCSPIGTRLRSSDGVGRPFDVGPEDTLSNHAPLHFDLTVFDLYLSRWSGRRSCRSPTRSRTSGRALVVHRSRRHLGLVLGSVGVDLLARTLPGPGALPRLSHGRVRRRGLPDQGAPPAPRPAPRVCAAGTSTDLPRRTSAPTTESPSFPRMTTSRSRSDARARTPRCSRSATTDSSPAVGEEGELFVRGTGVMDGYWGTTREDRRGTRAEPVAGRPRDMAYRTGDLVRLRSDGDYEFLGRRDHQIKSRGYRIELGDIEAALAANPAFLESAAVAVPHDDWGTADRRVGRPTERIRRSRSEPCGVTSRHCSPATWFRPVSRWSTLCPDLERQGRSPAADRQVDRPSRSDEGSLVRGSGSRIVLGAVCSSASSRRHRSRRRISTS